MKPAKLEGVILWDVNNRSGTGSAVEFIPAESLVERSSVGEPEVGSTIPLGELLELWRNGFQIVPLMEDGVTQYSGFKSSDIYDNPDFWTEEKIRKYAHLFKKVGTTFGKTRLKDKEGRNYYLNGLDLDSTQAFGRIESILRDLKLHTYVTESPSGYLHVYWLSTVQHPQILKTRCRKGHEFEIFTENHPCTLPPSKHRKLNEPYKCAGQITIKVDDGAYSKFTDKLKDCLRIDKTTAISSPDSNPVDLEDKEIDEIVGALRPVYVPDYRYHICFNLSGLLYRLDVSLDSAKELFGKLTQGDEERKSRFTTLEGTYKKDKKEVTGYNAFFDLLSGLMEKKEAKKITQLIYAKVLNHKDHDSTSNLAFQLKETIKHDFTFRVMNDTREVYHQKNGRFVPDGERIIEIECSRLVPRVKTSVVTEAVEMIKRDPELAADREDFDADLDIINMTNGLYRISTDRLESHRADYLSLIQTPFPHIDGANAEPFLKFLREVLYEEEIEPMLDAIAYTFYRRHLKDVINILLGKGNNGKTVLIAILTALHGEYMSNKSLKDIAGNRFTRANLEGKNVNLASETARWDGEDTAVLKDVTSNLPQSVERKGVQSYNARLWAKIWSAANAFPDFKDSSDAMMRRINLFDFPNQFIEGVNEDPKLADKLTTPESLAGIFNLLMPRLRKIIETGTLVMAKKTIAERREQVRLALDPVEAFIEDEFDPDATLQDLTLKDDVYKVFDNWCDRKRVPKLSEDSFGDAMKGKGYYDTRKTVDGRRRRYWLNVRLRSQPAISG